MDRLAELLAAEVDLDALSDEDLAARWEELKEATREANAGEKTRQTVDLITQGVAASNSTKGVIDARAEEAAAIIADSEAALAALVDVEPEETAEEAELEPEAVETAEVVDAPAEVVEAPAAEDLVAEPLAAAARKPLVRNVKVPARSRPRPSHTPGPVMVASGEVKGVVPGHQFTNIDEMHAAMFEKWDSLRNSGDGQKHHVATISYKDFYPESRRISGGDAFEVSNKLMAYIAERNEQMRAERALVASGGVPGPPEPNYNVITYGQADRPLRDGLPSVLMKRGSTIYNTSPVLSAVVLDTSLGAIGTVTSAQDLAGATKDIQEIPAPVPKTVTVEAETLRWSQGNFADRFLPEWTAAFMRLGQVAYARHNDALRLADIKANSTIFADTPAVFGAYRDLKRQFLGQLEELEDLIRDFSQPVRVLLPEYVPAMLAADLVAQQPGDDAYTITEEAVRRDVESWDPNVNITWLKDSIRGRLTTSPSGQSPRSAGFDADVEWAMFPEGAFVFGDGGQLDLGIIRDSVTSATNKFQTFYESWEALLPLVPSSLCFWLTSSLCAGGDSQAATDIAKCSPQGS